MPAAIAGHESLLLLKLASWLQSEIDTALRPGEMKARHFMTMNTLVHSEGRWTQNELARKLRIDKATMVAVIGELDRAGLLERTRDPHDSRYYLLRATPAGRGWVHESEAIITQVEAHAFAPLDAQDRDRLRSLIAGLFAAPQD